MAHYADTPPGYDYIVPPRVFAPLPNSEPRPFLGDDPLLFAPGPPEWLNARKNLAQSAPTVYQSRGQKKELDRQIGLLGRFRGRFRAKSRKQCGEANWKPVSLRAPFLVGLIATSVALMVILQMLLMSSQRDGGIIFATDVNSLPFSKSFSYLYLPTIIAVCYGFLWNWVDLDVRRIEPYLQLAKEDGATGQESLLLHYPVDFLASVPIKAMKSRHWPVFTASVATVLVFWGVTPSQSGIFAINTLNKTMDMPSMRSTTPSSLAQREEKFSAKSAQSVVSIMWLNETLPPFMTREYTLAPFGPPKHRNSSVVEAGNWTANTLKYSVDVKCEAPIFWVNDGSPMVNSTWGCSFQLPLPDVTPNPNATKIFNTMYAGYFNEDGLADYYLSGACPANESSSFLIQWSKPRSSTFLNGTGSTDYTRLQRLQHFNYTNLYCRSSYNVQEVQATIRLPSNEVLEYSPLAEATLLPSNLFNTSSFEASMSMGHELSRTRTDFPTTNWPSQTAFLTNIPLDLRLISTMAPFAIGASQLPLEDYLDPRNFADSYRSAYRLLFARQMVEMLAQNVEVDSKEFGQWSYQTQSVVLVPAFTYIVEALLALSALLAAVILYYSATRVSKLHTDPATIAAIMSLAADDPMLLRKLRMMDQSNEKELELHVRNRRFRLHSSNGSATTARLQLLDLRGNETTETFNDEIQAAQRQPAHHSSSQNDESKADIVNGLRPTEFKAKMGLAFLASQIALFSVIAGLFVTIQKKNGLPLPSSNRFVRQLLENYLPTAIGTFIEPFWVVLNRHLCFLQPFDEMRQGRKTGERSLGLEYSSLPPQLTIIKALSNGNILLGIVCTMALLANGLAISLSGLFFENTVDFGTSAVFTPMYASQFNSLDGKAGPFISENKQSLESVYIATSNRTANTPLPSWTDSQRFYFPFSIDSVFRNESQYYRTRTPTIGAKLACQALSKQSTFNLTGTQKGSTGQYTQPGGTKLAVSLVSDGERQVKCIPRNVTANGNTIFGQTTGASAVEFFYPLDGSANSSTSDASFCREHLAAGWVRAILVNGTLPANLSSSANQTIIASHEETIVTCKSILVAGSAEILVSGDGHVQKVYSFNTSVNDVARLLSTTSSDLIGQVHQIILSNVEGLHWHTDALPSDFLNYLIEQATNSSAHLDPAKPPPSFDSVVAPFDVLYSQLFATLVGRNMKQLLKPASKETNTLLAGSTVRPTTRIFMSKPMFIIAEVILILYICVTVILYLRRPWRILCRMPTSLGSIIAFFAASHTVKDFRGTVGLSSKQLKAHMEKMDDRYGFGTFIGTDGKAHVGVEKYPFLAPLTTKIGVGRQDKADGKQSRRNEWMSKFAQWKSGKVREGGWM